MSADCTGFQWEILGGAVEEEVKCRQGREKNTAMEQSGLIMHPAVPRCGSSTTDIHQPKQYYPFYNLPEWNRIRVRISGFNEAITAALIREKAGLSGRQV
jgi:hypothetical protein